MLVVLILALVLVIGSVKTISGASVYWNGYAGNALWLTITAAASLFLATICYLFKACCHRGYSYNGGSNSGNVVSPNKNHADKSRPFDLTPHHQPYNNNNSLMITNQQQQQPTLPQPHLLQQQQQPPNRNNLYPQKQQQSVSISSLSQQYSPGLQPQYLAPIYGTSNENLQPNQH